MRRTIIIPFLLLGACADFKPDLGDPGTGPADTDSTGDGSGSGGSSDGDGTDGTDGVGPTSGGGSGTGAGSGGSDGPPGTGGGSGGSDGPPDSDTGGDPGSTGDGTSGSTGGTEGDGNGSTGGAEPLCGDGVVEGDEECDGEDVAGKTCAEVEPGYGTRWVVCNDDCTLNFDHCVTLECDDDLEWHSIYGSCLDDAGCESVAGPGSICFTSGSWSPICTFECTDDADCAPPGVPGCGAPHYCDTVKGVCMLDCSVSGQCPPGMGCFQSPASDTGKFCTS